MNTKLLIIGASGHGKVIADIAIKMQKWDYIAFLDDDENLKYSMGFEIVGKLDEASKFIKDYDLFVAIGNNKIREKIQEELESQGANIPIIIHPNAVIGEQVKIASGVVVMPGVVINCCTEISKGCIINTGVTIDHDNILEEYVHISPGTHLAGTVKVGKSTWLGIGSTVINNLTIGTNCLIGAGSVVISDLPSNCTVVGIPAKPIKYQV